MSKIEPHDHPDFVGGIVWSRIEIAWIEERLQQAIAEAKQEAYATAAFTLETAKAQSGTSALFRSGIQVSIAAIEELQK